MAITFLILNEKYDYTGRAGKQISRFTQAVKSNFEKVCFVGGYAIMRISQLAFGKQKLAIPQYVQKNVVEGTEEDLNRVVGLGTADSVEYMKTAAFDTIDPIQRGFNPDDKITSEWLKSRGLPRELAQPRFREIYRFIVDSQLYRPIQYYKHLVMYDAKTDDIFLMVDDAYESSKSILSHLRLENRSSRERAFLPPFIVNMQTGERYAYLDKGLILHDSERDIRPYKVISKEEAPRKPQALFHFCLNGNFDSPEGVQELDHHTWCELIDTSGECYSFGLFAQGVVQSPDPTEFSDRRRYSLAFDVKSLVPLFKHVEQHRIQGSGNYHLSKYNCSSFVREICSLIDIRVSERCKLRQFDGIVNKIRMYAIASLLAKMMRQESNKNKITAVQELAIAVDVLNRMPVIGQKLMERYSLEHGMESISLKNTLNAQPGMREWLQESFSSLKNGFNESDAHSLTRLLNDAPISAVELKRLCQSLLDGSQRHLTYKVFNLFNDLFSNHIDYEICTPSALFADLRKAQVRIQGSGRRPLNSESNMEVMVAPDARSNALALANGL